MRKIILTCLVLGLAIVVTNCSKKENGLYTIGVFQIGSSPVADAARDGFVQGLRDAGYIDGENIKLNFGNAEGDISTAQLIAQKFVSDKVDMICAVTTPCLQAALNTTQTIPIVFTAIANPYRLGAGEDATHHRPNVTGASATSPIYETMELIQEVLPEAKRVGVIWNPGYDNSVINMELARESTERIGVELVESTVTGSAEVLQAAQTLATKDIDVIYVVPDHSVMPALESVIKVANGNHIPLFSNETKDAERGACASLSWDYFQNGVKSAELAVRVMRGEDISKIPFQGLEEKILHINLTAARIQGVTFPEDVLKRAYKVME